MVQPAENISRSYPTIGWQLMPMDARARPRAAAGIRDSGSKVGGGVGRIVHFGKIPVSTNAQVFRNVERPDGTTSWSTRFQMQFLFFYSQRSNGLPIRNAGTEWKGNFI